MSKLRVYELARELNIETKVVLGEKDWVLNNKRCEELINGVNKDNKDKKCQIKIIKKNEGHNTEIATT